MSTSAVPKVETYILRQKEHHKRHRYKAEFIELLRKHGIAFNEAELFE